MKDKVSEILHAGNTENNLNKAIAFSDVLMSASTADDLPESFSLYYMAGELYKAAKELQAVYFNLLEVLPATEEEEQAND